MAIWIPKLEGRYGPKYAQILEAMSEDIASGALPVGARLLPHRELAYRLGVSANTTSRAYAEGVKRALLRGEVGRGTFVRTPSAELEEGQVGDLRRPGDGPIDLSRNLPLPGFAAPHIRRVLGEIGQGEGLPALLDYQTEMDLTRHADAAIGWLEKCGITATRDTVTLTNGAQHGLHCALSGLLKPGDLLLVEELSYPPLRAMADRLGLQLATVSLDHHGVIPDSLDEACKMGRPAAFYLVPTLQAATGTTIPPERRRQIADIATRHGILLIEDDVFGLLKGDRADPIAVLAPERTVYVTSASKTVAPGLRIGILQAPEMLAPALRHAVNLSAWMTPPITAEVFARLVADGSADALITAQRAAAQRRQTLARAILGPGCSPSDPDGFHIWIPLPDAWSADRFTAEARHRGVLVSDSAAFAGHPSTAPAAIRLSLSHEQSETRLCDGLRRLANLLAMPPFETGLVI